MTKTVSKSMSSAESQSHNFDPEEESFFRYSHGNKDHLLNHFYVNNLEYSYRIKTHDVFDINEKTKSFDILLSHTTNKIYSQLSNIIASKESKDDGNKILNPYSNFHSISSSLLVKILLSLNLWRETLLLNAINEDCILKVTDFGLLPGNIIFRETEDYIVYTLEDYLDKKPKDEEDTINEEEKEIEDDMISHSDIKKNSFEEEATIFKRRKTYMTEDETIEVILRVIDLLETLHSREIIHTNLNPSEIFFKFPDNIDTL